MPTVEDLAEAYEAATDGCRHLVRWTRANARREQRVKPDSETHPLAQLDFKKEPSDQTWLGEGLLHLADYPPESSRNSPFHCQRIPHRIPAAVVVKVHEHVSAHALPLPHAVRPPAQIVLAIGARVKMMMVGPVKPGVDERRRRPQNTGEACAAHHAVRRPMLLQQPERAVLQPGRVAELDADAQPAWHALKEIGEPWMIEGRRGRKLYQEHPALRAETVKPLTDARQPGFRSVEALGVRQRSRGLDGDHEPVRQPPLPTCERGIGGPAVVARVQLHGLKLPGVVVKAALGR